MSPKMAIYKHFYHEESVLQTGVKFYFAITRHIYLLIKSIFLRTKKITYVQKTYCTIPIK
jgi:hypothetical protein